MRNERTKTNRTKSIKRKKIKEKRKKIALPAAEPSEASECAVEGALLGQPNTRPMTPLWSTSWADAAFFYFYYLIYEFCLLFLKKIMFF